MTICGHSIIDTRVC